jgi:hypothetical protein
LCCAYTDLGYDLFPEWDHSGYLCYQHTYSDRLRREPLRPKHRELPKDQTVRCVLFHYGHVASDDPRITKWLKDVGAEHKLVRHDSLRVVLHREEPRDYIGVYEVYRFEPRGDYGSPTMESAQRETRSLAK